MLETGRELLHKAIRAGSVAVLTTGAPESAERVIVRLSATSGSGDARLIIAAVEEGRAGLIERLIESATPVWGQIKVGEWVAIKFQTTLVSQQGRLFGRKVMLRYPQQVVVEQRARAPRERVPREIRVEAQFTFQNRRGPAITADVWDLSQTGVCLWCRAADLPKALQPDEPIELTLRHEGKDHPLTSRFKHCRPMENGGVRMGLEFAAPATLSPATSDAIRALIEVLSQLRIRRESEKFVSRAPGLAS